ncbi:MAG: NUDIX domain-containing protein [Corynebacterium sp.]|nr:NUDIX domain-containing protein [Corynebacterium sp.]
MSKEWLPVDNKLRSVARGHELVWIDESEIPADAGVRVHPEDHKSWGAVRVSSEYLEHLAATTGGHLLMPREITYSDYPELYKAAGQLRNREMMRFDPASGKPLHYPNDQRYGVTDDGTEVFPRTNPCVIGLVDLEGTDKTLIVRTAVHPQRWSVVAGYVENGETIEEAFIREVAEESGRRIIDTPQYLFSMPWPFSSSLMFAMRATTRDENPVLPLDGELVDMRWISKSEIRDPSFEMPAGGSTAGMLLRLWRDED